MHYGTVMQGGGVSWQCDTEQQAGDALTNN